MIARKTMSPWLSVIIPTYNGAAFLADALDSIVAQDDPGLEVVAVDDGSVDATRDILRQYSRELTLTVHEVPHRGNWTSGTNLGMSLARGDYLCWLHQDDAWCADRLRVFKELIQRFPDATLLLSPAIYVDGANRHLGVWRCPLPPAPRKLVPAEVLGPLLAQNFIAAPAPLFKASGAAIVGPLDEALWYLADWDFWLRMARIGPTVYCAKPLVKFRLHAGSQTIMQANRGAELEWQHKTVLRRHLRGVGFDRDTRRRVAAVARCSARVNLFLLRLAGGDRSGILSVALELIRLGPRNWRRYFHDSRIIERVSSRLRAGAPHWRHARRSRRGVAAEGRGAKKK